MFTSIFPAPRTKPVEIFVEWKQDTYFGEKTYWTKDIGYSEGSAQRKIYSCKVCIKQEEREFPSGSVVETLCFQWRGHEFNSWWRSYMPRGKNKQTIINNLTLHFNELKKREKKKREQTKPKASRRKAIISIRGNRGIPGWVQWLGSHVFTGKNVGSISPWSVSSATQSRLTLWDPMDCSTPDFPVHH